MLEQGVVKLTFPRDNGNGACRGSNRQGMPNAFSPRMVPSPNTSDPVVIGSPLPSTVKSCGKDARCGRKSRAQGWLPKDSVGPQLG